jgi:hypothetical protein
MCDRDICNVFRRQRPARISTYDSASTLSIFSLTQAVLSWRFARGNKLLRASLVCRFVLSHQLNVFPSKEQSGLTRSSSPAGLDTSAKRLVPLYHLVLDHQSVRGV